MTEALILTDQQGRPYAVARGAAEPLFGYTGEIDRIVRAVASVARLTPSQIRSSRRCKAFVRPRHVACWLAHKHTTHTLPEIGRYMGNRDHTSIIHAVRAVDQRLTDDDAQTKDLVMRAEITLGLWADPDQTVLPFPGRAA